MATQQRDPELDAVREAVALRTRDRELSLARAWGTIVARRAGVDDPPRRSAAADRAPGERRSPARRLVPMTAAATVAAVAIGTVTLLGPQWEGFGFLPGNPGSPNDHESYFPNLDPPSEQAVTWLNTLAAAAERGESARIEEGQLIYVRSEGWAAAFGTILEYEASPGAGATPKPTFVPLAPDVGVIQPQPREAWFDPNGMVLLRQDADGQPWAERRPGDGDPAPTPAEPTPGPNAPTPEWLAGLPTDPERLRAELRHLLRDDQTWSTDHAVWNRMSELYASAEILIPPEVRAALLRAFTELRGLTAVETEIAGRQLVGIRHIERDSGDEILFDPETGRAVGRRSVSLHEDLRLVVPTDGPSVDPAALEAGISYQSLWTQAIVDEVGETG